MERIPWDPEERERILKARMIRKGLPFISAPPQTFAPCIRCGEQQFWSFPPFDHGTC